MSTQLQKLPQHERNAYQHCMSFGVRPLVQKLGPKWIPLRGLFPDGTAGASLVFGARREAEDFMWNYIHALERKMQAP